MPSIISVVVREQIRLLKPLINKLSIETARIFQDKLGEFETRIVASKINVTPVEMQDFEACMVCPKEHEKLDSRVILYLHGGGYVAGNIKYACGFASILAATMDVNVFSAAYRLAPEYPFPAAVEDAFSAYTKLLELGYAPENISLIGESAGGGLIYSLCHFLKQKGFPLPSALVGISPWTDLTFGGRSYKFNKEKDPVLTEKAIRAYARAYARGHERNPLVSPIFGDFNDFPPSLIFAGGDELLLDDAKMLAEKLIQSDCKCELIIEEGLWHVYVLYKIPEANQALEKIKSFLELKRD